MYLYILRVGLVTRRLWVRVSGPAGIVGGGSKCPVVSPPSIPRLRFPWARHWTPNCSPRAATLAAHCSRCVCPSLIDDLELGALLTNTNTIQIKLRWALFVTYTIIQSIMRSEMCSLHLTHPSVHTWSSGQPTVQSPGSSHGIPVGAGIRTHNLGLPRVSSPTLYPLGQRLPGLLLVDYCDVFNQLFELLFWWHHSLQRIHWWSGVRRRHFQQICIFRLNLPFLFSYIVSDTYSSQHVGPCLLSTTIFPPLHSLLYLPGAEILSVIVRLHLIEHIIPSLIPLVPSVFLAEERSFLRAPWTL